MEVLQQFGNRGGIHSLTDDKVSEIGQALSTLTAGNSARRDCKRTYSPLRLLWWASLVVGARGQLTDPFPATLELSSLDGNNGFVINGEQPVDNSGYSVSCAGDVNGDGIDDIVIGARYASPSSRSRAGKSYVLFGSRSFSNFVGSGYTFELSSLNGTNGFILNGEASGDLSGISVSSVGDVNGDGYADLLIGALFASPTGRSRAGKSYVVFGRSSFSSLVTSGGSLELSSLDGSNGFILYGEAADDNSGISVSSAGDVNGDGLADLVIGARYANPSGRSNAGKSYIVFGSLVSSGGIFELSNLNGTNGFILDGEAVDDDSGYSVSTAGDVNGDGLADLVIGAMYADPTGKSAAGKSYVVFGSRNFSSLVGNRGTIELSSLNGTNGFILIGEAAGDESGRSVSSAGDVNGDGFSDLVIGALYADPSGRSAAGKSYVLFGSRSFRNLVGSEGTIELSSLNGTYGFILNGEAADDDSGRAVSSAGDVNGDGLADLVIGARYAGSSSVRSRAGKSYVIFGRRNFSSLVASGGTLELSSLNGSNGFILNGEVAGDDSGRSVSSAGDINGDGVSDFLIGAYDASSPRKMHAGKTYVVYGRQLSQPGSSISTPLTSSSLLSSSLPSTSMGQMKSTELTSTHSFSQKPTNFLMASIISSLEYTASPNQLTSDTQSIVLPLVLASSVVVCLSGVVVAVVVFRKCKTNDQKTDHELNHLGQTPHKDKNDGNYQIIPNVSEYDIGNVNVDENDSIGSL